MTCDQRPAGFAITNNVDRVMSTLLNTLLCWSLMASVSLVAQPGKADFSRDIRPLLAKHCFACHGPEAGRRKAGLRLDKINEHGQNRPNLGTVIVPGKPETSRLIQRVTSSDPRKRMPPADHGPPLSPRQIQDLRQWIADGAGQQTHWAFRVPRRPDIPRLHHTSWPANPLDAFVLSRLEDQGLRQSPEADRYTLVRRVTLDLIGLPPTPEEINQFVNDTQPGAWERLVDRLLRSPHHGERMAQNWLDAARHADTTGHAADMPRTTWLFRDWVIQAYNSNMPFDRFTIEQLAGDMLPNATTTQRIATGFHRNSMQALGNNPRKEEFRVKGIVDRLDTTGRVWLGITLACAECHDHKYDPITTREYYELFAVFNNIPHYGEKFGVHGPRLETLSMSDHRRLTLIDAQIAALAHTQRDPDSQAARARFAAWLQNPLTVTRTQHPVAHWPLDTDARTTASLGPRKPSDPTALVFGRPGPLDTMGAVAFDGQHALIYADRQRFDLTGSLAIGVWIKTRSRTADLVSKYDWKTGQRAFVLGLGAQQDPNGKPGHLSAWISARPEPFSGITINGSVPVNDGQWHHVAVSFTAGQKIDLFVDGKRDAQAKRVGSVPGKIARSTVPLAIGGGYDHSQTPNAFFFRGLLADLRLFDRPLNGRQLGGLTPQQRELLRARRSASAQQLQSLKKLHTEIDATADPTAANRAGLQTQRRDIQRRVGVAQVMDELPAPRASFVHIRGDFENPGVPVSPGVPAFLPAWDKSTPVNRLTFARSLVDGTNPLTARVTVNRIWQHYFGRGLVRTPDDFGTRAEPPTHPQLLDWLAVELTASEWDLRHMHRLIVTSATYRQSSVTTPELAERDPTNRLLARGARFRLAAEQIRDCALSVSGQLYRQIGGASVFPHQPDGIGQFRDATAGTWKTTPGPVGQRRGLYTFWQRMSPYPSLILFDAPSRERSCVLRPITNTPLQALATLNDPVFVQAARALGSRINKSNATESQRIAFAFMLCLSRPPRPDEQRAFQQFIETAENRQAGWFRAAQVLLNLDEAITRE